MGFEYYRVFRIQVSKIDRMQSLFVNSRCYIGVGFGICLCVLGSLGGGERLFKLDYLLGLVCLFG